MTCAFSFLPDGLINMLAKGHVDHGLTCVIALMS